MKDITCVIQFLDHFNSTIMFLQSCLTGVGAIWESKVYAASCIMTVTQEASIIQLQMCNMLLAIRSFAKVWSKNV